VKSKLHVGAVMARATAAINAGTSQRRQSDVLAIRMSVLRCDPEASAIERTPYTPVAPETSVSPPSTDSFVAKKNPRRTRSCSS
jgi:hypothetical protein